MLDFNAIEQPTWQLRLRDKEQTIVTISAPSVQLFDRLVAVAPELEKVAKEKNGKTILAVYELVAELMSQNEDGFTFTAEELRDKYHMTLVDVFKFVAGYFEFIKEIQNAKN
ncbi:MAG: hypothetical protein II265_05070 [Clostridia bacterium]|nr:hypothetical protein [Clostridia bacterium]